MSSEINAAESTQCAAKCQNIKKDPIDELGAISKCTTLVEAHVNTHIHLIW